MWTSFAGMEYEKPVKPNIGWWGAVGESLWKMFAWKLGYLAGDGEKYY
jgi:hypothetical protein